MNEVSVSYETPEILDVDIDWDKVLRAVGNAEAKRIRDALKGGTTATGDPLPAPLPLRKTAPAGRPLNRTGALIESIKYRNGLISPSTTNRPEVGARARSNFGLLAIHHSGKYTSRNVERGRAGAFEKSRAVADRRGTFDALGSQDPKLEERLNEAVQKQIEKRRKIALKAKNKTGPVGV